MELQIFYSETGKDMAVISIGASSLSLCKCSGPKRLLSLKSVLVLLSSLFWPTNSDAQWRSGQSSLGGYGGARVTSEAGMNTPGLIMPYMGNYSGFKPYRSGASGEMSLRPFGGMVSSTRVRSMQPFSQGMGLVPSAGMVGGAGRLGIISSYSPMGGISTWGANRKMRPGVMPPDLGSPFALPTRIIPGTSMSSGISM